MRGPKSSFWRDVVNTFATYMLVGLCLIPFATAYALISVYRVFGSISDSLWVMALCLGLGLFSAAFVVRHRGRGHLAPSKLVTRSVMAVSAVGESSFASSQEDSYTISISCTTNDRVRFDFVRMPVERGAFSDFVAYRI